MCYPDEHEIYNRISVEINRMLEAITKIDEEAKEKEWGIKPEVEDKITEVGKTNAAINYLKGRL